MPSEARIAPRSILRCSSRGRALRLLRRSEAAWKIVQREVNATSRANSRTTKTNRRAIGSFTARPSFQLAEFEAAYEGGRVAFGAQRVIEQLSPARRTQRRGAHARDVGAAGERQPRREPHGEAPGERGR